MNSMTPPDGFTLVQADTVEPQRWRNGGGQTRELLAWPSAVDWKLRISRADIAADGPFSAFMGVDRWFTVLEGAGVTLHFSGEQSKTVTLRLGDAPLHFDGARAPGCTLLDGATQDLNLMARTGCSTLQQVQTHAPWSPSFAVNGVYTATRGTWCSAIGNEGQVDWEAGTMCVALPAHSLLWCHSAQSVPGNPQAKANATLRWIFTPDTSDVVDTRAWWLGYTPNAL